MRNLLSCLWIFLPAFGPAGAASFLRRIINQGWEYHIAMGYGDLADALETLARILRIEAVRI